jgi:hypothetical protein
MGKKIDTTIIFCQDNIKDANRIPTGKSKSKGKSIVEYKLGMITKDQCVYITNCTKKKLLFLTT